MQHSTATIIMDDGGEITVELYPEHAPQTVENFLRLVKRNFYDGLIFHRVIKDFMIQGGDPTGTGSGGSDTKIKGEFAANGVINNLRHTAGIISMARGSDPDSASCQFFITHAVCPHLDGNYASFGKVISGMDVVDKIAKTPTDKHDRPLTEQRIKTIKLG